MKDPADCPYCSDWSREHPLYHLVYGVIGLPAATTLYRLAQDLMK